MPSVLNKTTAPGLQANQMLVMVGWIGLIHFVVEAAIMGMLSGWDLSRRAVEVGLLDSTLLTIMSSPLIYMYVAKPFINSAHEAEAALSRELLVQAEQAATLETALTRLTHSLELNEELRLRLQQANEKVAEINERTLQRIGADLHDGPAQLLTYALLRLGKFSPVIASKGGPSGAVELEYMRDALTDTLTEVRNISQGLSLPQLGSANLEESIALAVTMHQEQTGTKVDMSLRGLPDEASQAVKVCVYRVVQESLFNAYKHGGASEQKVAAFVDGQLVLEISDSGPGFDLQACPTDGLGLTGMRARVEALGGTLTIHSSPGHGTRLSARIELENLCRMGVAHV